MNMDLGSYAGILAGSHRPKGEPKGNDVLGGGVWENSILHQMLHAENGQSTVNRTLMPLGRTDTPGVPDDGPLIFAGRIIPAESATK